MAKKGVCFHKSCKLEAKGDNQIVHVTHKHNGGRHVTPMCRGLRQRVQCLSGALAMKFFLTKFPIATTPPCVVIFSI